MSTQHLFTTVIKGGFCVGCGACAAIPDSGLNITYTELGTYRAQRSPEGAGGSAEVERICPFSDLSANEDTLGAYLFPKAAHHAQIGHYLATYAGSVAEGEYRAHGSSGGLVTWLTSKLLLSGAVDGVAHVRSREPTENDGRLFAFAISRDLDTLQAGAKSRYYPIEMSGVLREIAEQPGRYAIVGVPCFIKAIRLLQQQSLLYAERICYTIGLVCGHLKSAGFAQSLSWQMGVHPRSLRAIDFRHKLPDQPANDYGVRVWPRDEGQPVTKPTSDLFGCDWGWGLFKYRACDYCDDVLAETADVAIGDAWLPDFVLDSRGANIVIVRTPELAKILSDAIVTGTLDLLPISPDAVALSQAAGLRHRREGLAHRLWKCSKARVWHPPKRVNASRAPTRRRIYDIREALLPLSHSAFQEALRSDDFGSFIRALSPMLKTYANAYAPTRSQVVTTRLLRRFLTLVRQALFHLRSRR